MFSNFDQKKYSTVTLNVFCSKLSKAFHRATLCAMLCVRCCNVYVAFAALFSCVFVVCIFLMLFCGCFCCCSLRILCVGFFFLALPCCIVGGCWAKNAIHISLFGPRFRWCLLAIAAAVCTRLVKKISQIN